jgi:hypothetical protein
MYITPTKNLTLEEIEALSDEDLRSIFAERVEEWFIKPMEILDQHGHTGFAVAYLMKQIIALRGAEGEGTLDTDDFLGSSSISVSGDSGYVFSGPIDNDLVVVNPHLVADWSRRVLRSFVIDVEKFRKTLLDKVKKTANICELI